MLKHIFLYCINYASCMMNMLQFAFRRHDGSGTDCNAQSPVVRSTCSGGRMRRGKEERGGASESRSPIFVTFTAAAAGQGREGDERDASHSHTATPSHRWSEGSPSSVTHAHTHIAHGLHKCTVSTAARVSTYPQAQILIFF